MAFQWVDWTEYIMAQPKGKQKDVVLVVEMVVQLVVCWALKKVVYLEN